MERPRILAAIAAIVAAASMTGCERNQIHAWIDWWEDDPEAAVEFARQDWVQDELRNRNQPGEGDTSEIEEARDASSGSGKWDVIAECESGGNWSINTGNGYSGGLQFLHSSWRAYGGQEFAPLAYQASKAEQIIVAERILDDAGWRAWPTCSARAGFR